jgi:transposase-like protein
MELSRVYHSRAGPADRSLLVLTPAPARLPADRGADIIVWLISRIAGSQHGVSANQLLYWRKLYRAGQLSSDERSAATSVHLAKLASAVPLAD